MRRSSSRRGFLGTAATAAGGCFLCGLARSNAEGTGSDAELSRTPDAAGPVGEEVLGYCGLYCGGCQAYQETTSEAKAGAEPTERCLGCASDVVAPWCRECAIRDCCKEKGLRYCLPCNEYPCDKLRAFTDDPRYPYHKAVHADMARLREIGLPAWLKEQSVRWICPSCGHRYHWFARQCPTCNARVNEEYWP